MTKDPNFEVYEERAPQGMFGRALYTIAQLLGLQYGWLNWYVQDRIREGTANSFSMRILRGYVFLGRPFVDKELVEKPFPVQFRLRLERMGPAYIKLGQILSLREDILPVELTDEFKNLLSELPAVSLDRLIELIEQDLDRPIETMFAWISPTPLGSASLGQTHMALLYSGELTVVKVLKPGVRQTIIIDTRLMRLMGRFGQIFFARFQPKQIIDEFARYTLKEVDLRNEATNAEIFAANFSDEPDVHFPLIFREFSNRDVLCMQYFAGQQPSPDVVATMSKSEKAKVLDLGIGAIVDMIFRDGFFHADLHPANLIIFDDGSVGFIDLGMVGRLDSDTRKRMMYYYFALANEDAAGAARHLTAMAKTQRGSDVDGFRQAVEDLNVRWLRSPTFDEFSVGQLVLRSVGLAGKYRVSYPSEIILMVKALVTVEGVGNQLEPGINITQASVSHIRRIMSGQFNLMQIAKDSVIAVPELLDVLQRTPLVLNQLLRIVESGSAKDGRGPLDDVMGTIFAVGLLLAAAIMAIGDVSILIWGSMIAFAFLSAGIDALRR